MSAFQFATAGRIVFGPGTAADVPGLASSLGRRACLVTGSNPGRAAFLARGLEERGLEPLVVSVAGEPSVDAAAEAGAMARDHGCDVVVSMGGGGAMDAGKAVSALLSGDIDIMDHIEVVGRGLPLTGLPAPHIACPTTAGTGSEVTANAVLASKEHAVKASLRSPMLLPAFAMVDPRLCLSAPPSVTAATGMDALTQLIEALVSAKATPMTEALCRQGLPLVARSLRRAFEDGSDLAARADMSLAALFSGMALANGGLGAAHGLAAPLGGRFGAPHGAVCAALIPHVMDTNVRNLRQAGDETGLARYADAARLLTGSPTATPEDGAAWVAALNRDLAIKPLSAFGLTGGDLPDVAAQAARASSMKGNPVALTEDELTEIMALAL